MSSSKNSDLERNFAAAIYLPEASPPRFLSWGWSSNFVGPESRQIHSVKSGFRIRIHFLRIRIRIQRIRMEANTDPDQIRIQGFNDQKLKKK
jgi:hypothetical protein